MIRAILACDEDGGVSKDGTIPWPKNTKDLAWFKKNTIDSTVVMGSKTWTEKHETVEFQIWEKRKKVETIS